MALIEINIPEDEGWRDDLASRLLLVAFAAALFQFGLRLWAGVDPQGLLFAIPTFVTFAAAVQLLVFAATGVDLEAHGRRIGYVFAVVLTVLTLVALWLAPEWIRPLNTDLLAFTRVGLDMIWLGDNPMAHSMRPAFHMEGTGPHWTQRVDGSRVTQWSYPGGSFLYFLPQYLVFGTWPVGIRTTSIVVVGVIAAVLTWMLPAQYAFLGPAALIAPRQHWLTAAGGLNDMLWVLPAVVALWLWAHAERGWAAVALGCACGVKQTPWVILPFLAVWVAKTAPGWRAFVVEAVRLNVAGLLGFFVLAGNAIFLWWSPAAFVESVLTPLGGSGAPLRAFGAGLSVFAYAGVAVPRWLYTVGVVAVAIASVALYWRFFEVGKWAGWVAPVSIYLLHSRSLPSYFNWWFVLAVLAVVAAAGELRDQQVAGVYGGAES